MENDQTISGSPDQKNSPPAQMNSSDGEDTDPMEDFNQQLEDIIQTYGSAASLMEQQISSLEAVADRDNLLEEPGGDLEEESGSAPGSDTSNLIKSLEKLSSPEEKVEIILKKYIELVKCQQGEQRRNNSLQKKSDNLLMQKDQLQFDLSRAILARAKLESLCRDLQEYNKTLKVEHLQKRHEDEDKRRELTTHFQSTLTDIQAQIEEHSNRNSKLCQENSILAEKLNNIIHQYEKREESLEKIFKHHEMQQKLSEAKLEQANMLLKEAEVKHKREKEYLLKEAIAITKKCHAMKEQELQMKKQAAEWKLQAKELKEQQTVMQAQLVLYAQKFDEFQVTLGKSNDVYVSFKQEMDKMTKRMKKMEKESEFWKTRFESCNKALQDLIEQRSEKAKEFELFTLKVDKLETLCRALQEERKGLYDKIRGIRFDISQATMAEEPAVNISEDIPSVGLTVELERLNAEQVRLQEFAASLATSNLNELDDSDDEEEDTQCPVKLPSVPEESSETSPENKMSKSDPCHQESKTEQIQSDRAESEIEHPTEQGAGPAEEGTKEPSKPVESKAEDPAPEQLKQECKDTEKDCKHDARAELGLSKEAIPDVVLPMVKVDANQQEPTNSQPVQESSTPLPKQTEKEKGPETKETADQVQPGKQERKKSKVPKEKPAIEGAVGTEAAPPSQAQSQTSKIPSAKPQGKKQGTPKKKSQSKNVKK